ncbi:MAG TPA: polyphosphate kinase 2, partial [Allosphingosinicella sp.]|nr:polyphosphate kinase 2 [Allosphingosinicella sp.]
MGKLKRKDYQTLLEEMQVELNDMARWVQDTGQRMLIIFEGRDTAGKG